MDKGRVSSPAFVYSANSVTEIRLFIGKISELTNAIIVIIIQLISHSICYGWGGEQMAIIRQKDRKTGTVYVYEAVSTYHPELKQSRSKRHLIGKVDPSSGEVVPCGKRGRPRKVVDSQEGRTTDNSEAKGLRSQVVELSLKNAALEETVRNQRDELQQQKILISKLQSRMSRIRQYANEDSGL